MHRWFLLVESTWSLIPWQHRTSRSGPGLQLAHQGTAEIFKSSLVHRSILSCQPTGYWITDQLSGPQKDCQLNVTNIGNWSVAYHVFYLNSVAGQFGKLDLNQTFLILEDHADGLVQCRGNSVSNTVILIVYLKSSMYSRYKNLPVVTSA